MLSTVYPLVILELCTSVPCAHEVIVHWTPRLAAANSSSTFTAVFTSLSKKEKKSRLAKKISHSIHIRVIRNKKTDCTNWTEEQIFIDQPFRISMRKKFPSGFWKWWFLIQWNIFVTPQHNFSTDKNDVITIVCLVRLTRYPLKLTVKTNVSVWS